MVPRAASGLAALGALAALAACRTRPIEPAPVVIPTARGSAPVVVDASAPAPPVASREVVRDACPPLPGFVRAADVTQVDWCACSALSRFGSMKDCRAELHEYEALGGPHDTSIDRVLDVAYGDLDGDGVAEAVVPVAHVDHYARAGISHEGGALFVYAVRADGLRRLVQRSTRAPERVSVDGGIVTLHARGGCVERFRLQTTRGEPALAVISPPCP